MRPVILASAVALAFVAAGCGGGGSDNSTTSAAKPETWATGVCNAVLTWQRDLQSGSRQVSSDIRKSTNLKEAKRRLVAFLQAAEQNTEKLVNDVKGAGAPPVDNGPAIERELESVLNEASTSFKREVTRAKRLPTDNPQALNGGLTSIAQSIQSDLQATGNPFQSLDKKLDTSDLRQEMADSPSCKSFLSSSG